MCNKVFSKVPKAVVVESSYTSLTTICGPSESEDSESEDGESEDGESEDGGTLPFLQI